MQGSILKVRSQSRARLGRPILRLAFLVTGVLITSGCGDYSQATGAWPAAVISLTGFNAEDSLLLENQLAALNETADQTVVTFNSGAGATISIRFVEEIEGAAIASPSMVEIHSGGRGVTGQKVYQIAGRAIVSGAKCEIELAHFTRTSQKGALFRPVLWHEVGHCAGLNHVTEEGELMSPVTLTESNYNDEKIARFVKNLLTAIGSGV